MASEEQGHEKHCIFAIPQLTGEVMTRLEEKEIIHILHKLILYMVDLPCLR
jgi:hypothetical protein